MGHARSAIPRASKRTTAVDTVLRGPERPLGVRHPCRTHSRTVMGATLEKVAMARVVNPPGSWTWHRQRCGCQQPYSSESRERRSVVGAVHSPEWVTTVLLLTCKAASAVEAVSIWPRRSRMRYSLIFARVGRRRVCHIGATTRRGTKLRFDRACSHFERTLAIAAAVLARNFQGSS